jgi:hypothetical protein
LCKYFFKYNNKRESTIAPQYCLCSNFEDIEIFLKELTCFEMKNPQSTNPLHMNLN